MDEDRYYNLGSHDKLFNQIDELTDALASRDAEIESMRQQLSAAQAKIDELMLEYCPEEMTQEQIAEYEKHQRPAWRNFSLELKKEQK